MNYECIPKRRNHKAHGSVLALILAAVLCLIGAGFMPAYAVLVQTLAILLFVPAIYLAGKFLLMRYLYSVRTLDDGSVDLDVYMYRGGTKMQLVGRMGLTEITNVALLGKENRKPAKGLKRYSYCVDMTPDKAIVLSICNEDGECEVLLSFDETLAELLRTQTGRSYFEAND